MVRIAVVEDEQEYVERISEYLEQYKKEYQEELQVTVYRDGDGILAEYKSQFDIIFMDIQMKFVDGMTAAEEIRMMDSEVVIIFITNMTQYAIRGYQVDALDYVLKPITYFTFSQKLKKAIMRIGKREKHYIMVSGKEGLFRMDTGDIYYIESQKHNLIYHTAKGEIVASGTMKAAEEQLDGLGFSKGNKGYLINLEHVDGIREKCAVVKGDLLQISRARMNAFMQDLTRYWGEQK